MGSPEDFQSLLQLSFAAAVAGWLVRWLTTTQQKALDKNTTQVLNLQLFIGELYRVLLLQDALLRGLDLLTTNNDNPQHQQAVVAYQKTVERLDAVKASIEKSLESS